MVPNFLCLALNVGSVRSGFFLQSDRIQELAWITSTIDRSVTLTISLNNNRFNHKYKHVPYC